MTRIKNMQDFVGGVLVLASGIAIAIFAALNYTLGTPRQMGPGMFPMGVGLTLALLGIVILIPAFLRAGRIEHVALRPAVAVLVSILVFAFTLRSCGLIVAIVLQTGISSLADRDLRLRSAAVLAVVLSVFAFLVFRVGLGLAIPMLRWPF